MLPTSWNDLVAKLNQDQRVHTTQEESSTTLNIYNRSRHDSPSMQEQRDVRNAEFLYFHLFFQSLIRMPRNDHKAKEELIKAWSEYAGHDEHRQRAIDLFDKEYKPSKAFYWYSKQEFLYSVLNAALRKHDVDALFAMRFFLVDLMQALTEKHRQLLTEKSYQNGKIILFRGQEICIDELNLLRDSEGESMSFNGFLSTSKDKCVAEAFADVPTTITSTGILYEITVDVHRKNTPFAEITEETEYHDENETLISAGAIFRIGQVAYDVNQKLWIAKLFLCSNDDYELNLISKFEEDQLKLDDADALGWIFYKQGLYPRARQFFQNLLQEPVTNKTNPHEIANWYRGLGFVLRELEEYDEALKNHKEEFRIRIRMDPTGKHINIATNYIALADVYKWKKRLKLAFKYLARAYNIIPPKHFELSILYTSVADVYQENKQLELAMKYYKRSLDITNTNFPENHFEIAVNYQNMGALYSKLGMNTEAISLYEKARSIWLKSSLKGHKKFKELDEAIQARMKAIVDKQSEPYTDQSTAQ